MTDSVEKTNNSEGQRTHSQRVETLKSIVEDIVVNRDGIASERGGILFGYFDAKKSMLSVSAEGREDILVAIVSACFNKMSQRGKKLFMNTVDYVESEDDDN